jgi:hypothetical protein
LSDPVHNGQLVDGLRVAIAHTDGLDLVPEILRRVLEENAWRERIEQRTGETFGFASFPEFVAARPLDGLGIAISDLEAILKVRDEHDVLRRLHEACKGKPGPKGDGNSVDNRHETRPAGTTRARALTRLHRDRPDLYQRVLDGDLSANRAAIEAGFRRPTASVPIDSPEAAIQALLRKFSAKQLRAALEKL